MAGTYAYPFSKGRLVSMQPPPGVKGLALPSGVIVTLGRSLVQHQRAVIRNRRIIHKYLPIRAVLFESLEGPAPVPTTPLSAAENLILLKQSEGERLPESVCFTALSAVGPYIGDSFLGRHGVGSKKSLYGKESKRLLHHGRKVVKRICRSSECRRREAELIDLTGISSNELYILGLVSGIWPSTSHLFRYGHSPLLDRLHSILPGSTYVGCFEFFLDLTEIHTKYACLTCIQPRPTDQILQ